MCPIKMTAAFRFAGLTGGKSIQPLPRLLPHPRKSPAKLPQTQEKEAFFPKRHLSSSAGGSSSTDEQRPIYSFFSLPSSK